MKFGLFYNPMVPRPAGQLEWEPDAEQRVFASMVEQIRFADSLGIDYVFLGEHHFLPEYAHNSATEVLIGALAQATSRIRIGTGIVQTSHNDPVRVAERIAMADVLSDGRIEFGFGPGGSVEIEPLLSGGSARKRERSHAAAQIAIDILASPGVWPGATNEFFSLPPVHVVPKVRQRPHPPLWTSTALPGMAPSVAARGLGQLMLTVGGPETVAREVELYWDSLRSAPVHPMGRGINPVVFTFAHGLLAPTDELADERAREGVEFFGFGLTGGHMFGVSDPHFHLWDAFTEFKEGRGDIRARAASVPQKMIDIGSRFADVPGVLMSGPERARRFVAAIEKTHVDGLLLNQHFGHTAHEHLMESIEIFATEVIPEFRERDAEHAAWRRTQLEIIGLPVVSSL